MGFAMPSDAGFVPEELLQQAGHVAAVETSGMVDGPGLRYVVFLGGCPLRCQYCHNPDMQGPASGQHRTVAEVIEDLLKYRGFMRRGGLTISGGEPMLQPAFVSALTKVAKAYGIHVALDTSGFLGDNATDALLRDLDLVLLDIKGGLPETYKRTTGVRLEPTLAFAQRLEALQVPMWVRFVLVPGLTDAEENIEPVASFVASLQAVERVEILPFHKLGECKYDALGKPYQLRDTPTPTPEAIDHARAIFARHGITAL
jgi:pyruvate formate lyase activating enzyme